MAKTLRPIALAADQRTTDQVAFRTKVVRALTVVPLIAGAIYTLSLAMPIALPTFICAVLVLRNSTKAIKYGSSWSVRSRRALWLIVYAYGALVALLWAVLAANSFTSPDGEGLWAAVILTAWWVPFCAAALYLRQVVDLGIAK